MKAHPVARWKLQIATTACKFLGEKIRIFECQIDENTDSVVRMRPMTRAKILKSTWLALFAEIIVSDKEVLIL